MHWHAFNHLPETPRWSGAECRPPDLPGRVLLCVPGNVNPAGSPYSPKAHLLSTIFAFTPALASALAHMTPAGPAPMMSTSTCVSFEVGTGIVSSTVGLE